MRRRAAVPKGHIDASGLQLPAEASLLRPLTVTLHSPARGPLPAAAAAQWWEVGAVLVTVMFGAGVLGLPYAVAMLGWVS